MNNKTTLIVLTRNDIIPGMRNNNDKGWSPGYQMAQGGHSIARFCLEHAIIAKEVWKDPSEYLIMLSVSQEQLDFYLEQIKERKAIYSTFHEPDIQNQLTSVAVLGTQEIKELTRSLPLSLSKQAKDDFDSYMDYFVDNEFMSSIKFLKSSIKIINNEKYINLYAKMVKEIKSLDYNSLLSNRLKQYKGKHYLYVGDRLNE